MKIHIVKSGDTLYELSKKYNVPLQKIIDTNPQISDPNELKIGQKVKIPAEPVQVPSNDQIIHKHVVKQGDTLWKLSKAWGVSLKGMIDANPQLKNPNALLVGEVVNIPKTKGIPNENVNVNANEKVLPEGKANTAPKEEITSPKAETIAPSQMVPQQLEIPNLPNILPNVPNLMPETNLPNVMPNVPNVMPEMNIPNIMPEMVKPNIMPEMVKPNIMPEMVKPNIMPEMVKPNVMPEMVKPNVMPEMIMPNMMPNVMPEMVMPNMMPNVMPEMVKPNVMPNMMPNVMPEMVMPNMMPNVMPEMVMPNMMPNVMPEMVMPNMMPNVMPEMVTPNMMPNVMPEMVMPNMMPNVMPEMVNPNMPPNIMPFTQEPFIGGAHHPFMQYPTPVQEVGSFNHMPSDVGVLTEHVSDNMPHHHHLGKTSNYPGIVAGAEDHYTPNQSWVSPTSHQTEEGHWENHQSPVAYEPNMQAPVSHHPNQPFHHDQVSPMYYQPVHAPYNPCGCSEVSPVFHAPNPAYVEPMYHHPGGYPHSALPPWCYPCPQMVEPYAVPNSQLGAYSHEPNMQFHDPNMHSPGWSGMVHPEWERAQQGVEEVVYPPQLAETETFPSASINSAQAPSVFQEETEPNEEINKEPLKKVKTLSSNRTTREKAAGKKSKSKNNSSRRKNPWIKG
ncbi:LysM peptidoglycan-binding domain-containing protein [Paenibacillus sp.]|uniref:LysM peptidoglycan-binding domain-containing protein n=1 Tax=Paenibacillus sp. TaxID=58172 RepID=UPI00282F1A6B|nr:LysM peptidoglycan-binding domain-containing protein [Paenibacillus sp.]MDR0267777.1 LysM peptidoglycan-binding domain-containing protein [Paenibacillus sp.]